MKILLVKPRPEAVQFGLAPFFQTEPLGLEYIAAALEHNGHEAAIVDMRFERRSFASIYKSIRPAVVGIACLHVIDASATMALADEIKAIDSTVLVVVGGHAASAYPESVISSDSIDAVCIGEGEKTMTAVIVALENGRSIGQIPSLLLRGENGIFEATKEQTEQLNLNTLIPPDRTKVERYQKHYCCLNYMPVWTLETTRGCPYRCKFCSIWQFYKRSCRFHPAESVLADFSNAGHNLFIIDDIFWANEEQSGHLARELLQTGKRKNWILVQSRADLVADNADLLELWRPLAESFDIFIGFEAPTSRALDSLNKDTVVDKIPAALEVAREHGFGVTGNFIIDPNYEEEDFQRLWDFVDQHQLYRVGFTILTPLPGTHYFDEISEQILVKDWSQYDLHHLLWRPKLPLERFWELYCETWRRSVLNLSGRKKLWSWLKSVNPMQIPRLIRILARTQRLMDPKAYLAESKIPEEC